MGIFTEAMNRIEQDIGEKISGWYPVPSNEDPPDIVFNCGESRVAVEITELVNPKAIAAQINNNPLDYSAQLSSYGVSEAVQDLSRILKEKEEKIVPVREKFNQAVLLIHTDEPMLSASKVLASTPILSSEIYSRVYLLFSHEPESNECPLIRLL